MERKKENKELQKLVDINQDACRFYNDACEDAESGRLKTTLKDLESIHRGVVVNLQKRIRENGGETEADGTMAGKTGQFFRELIAKASNDIDESLVSHLEEAEDRCLHSIQDAMDEDDISAETKTLLAREYSTLQKTHDYMKALKDCMKAA